MVVDENAKVHIYIYIHVDVETIENVYSFKYIEVIKPNVDQKTSSNNMKSQERYNGTENNLER